MKRRYAAYVVIVSLVAVIGCNANTSTKTPPTPSTSVSAPANTSQPSSEEANSLGDAAFASNVASTEPMDGYVLICPLRSPDTYLLDADAKVVHQWKSNSPPAGTAYLMANGDLLRGARDPDFEHFRGGGIGHTLERYSWDGELLWSYRYADESHCMHHDIAPLPNGNVLMIAWERKSKEEAIAQGRDPDLLMDDLWPDHVVEIQPEGTDGGTIVWEWHMWDHLIQDFDRDKPNYGVIYEHPELIDLNNTGSTPPSTPEELRKLQAVGYTGGGDDKNNNRRGGSDWLHTNAIDYNPVLDQIALSAKHFSEVWIIDHSTTTEEAASHRGGKRGKGGDLLYRWGNPWAYKSGTIEDKILFDQHDVRWIPPRFPGAGHITAFNNGQGRDYSSIVEIETSMDGNGDYVLDEQGRYGPKELAWEYTAENKTDFFSSFISGATRLPNGNTYICEGAKGRFFEVNSDGKILWEHVNKWGGELTMDGRPNDAEKEAQKIVAEGVGTKSFVENNALFRATKYTPDHPALVGKSLTPLSEQPVPFATKVNDAVARLRAEAAQNPANDESQAQASQVEVSTDAAAASDADEEVHGEANSDADAHDSAPGTPDPAEAVPVGVGAE